MNIGQKVKKRRLELGMTQDQLSNLMGYSSRSSINKIENGRNVSEKVAKKIADCLQINFFDLFDEELNVLTSQIFPYLPGSTDIYTKFDSLGNLSLPNSKCNQQQTFALKLNTYTLMIFNNKNHLKENNYYYFCYESNYYIGKMVGNLFYVIDNKSLCFDINQSTVIGSMIAIIKYV